MSKVVCVLYAVPTPNAIDFLYAVPTPNAIDFKLRALLSNGPP
jgi:hypothetical protein